MPEYLAPGVYAEEKEICAKPIESVSTSTAGFLGDSERGTIKMNFLERHTTKLSFAVSLLDDYSKGKPRGRVEVSLKDRKEKAIRNLSSYYLFLDLPDGTYTVQVRSDYYFDEESDINLPRPVDFAFRSGSGGAEPDSTEAILQDISGLRDRDVLEFDNESDPPERRMIFLDSDPTTNKIHWETDPRGGLEYDYGEDAKIRLPVPENLIIRMMLKPKSSYPFPPGATLIRGMVYDSAGKPASGAEVKVKGKDVENQTTEKGEFVLYFGPLTEDEIIREVGKRFVKGNGDKTLHLEVDLFSIDAEFEDDLNNGIISEKLKDIFKTKGFPISENAMVTKEKENEWVITDEEKFVVRKEAGKLNIYLKPIELEAEEGKTTSVII